MLKDFYRLEDVIDLARFQRIQDDIARATEMAILTVDYKGVPFTKHSQCQPHCARIREIAHFNDLCMRCDSRGGLEAARLQKPYIYLCHRGLVDLAVPIVVGGQYVGAVMAGQVRLVDDEANEANEANALEKRAPGLLECPEHTQHTQHPERPERPEIPDHLEQLVTDSGRWLQRASEKEQQQLLALNQLRDALPVMKRSKIEAIANMLLQISGYIVEEAMMKARLSSGVTELRPSPPNQRESLILPALQYIDAHLADKIYIEQMANLCNVSVSYFSKCFNQVTGQSFAAYHNLQRVNRSMALLEATLSPISAIADQLGFDSPGYFIKIFKEYQGVTPAVYRDQYRAKFTVERSINETPHE